MKAILCLCFSLLPLSAALAQQCAAVAQDCCECCDRCGASGACCKICCLVPSTKKVTKPKYECKCEDFCVPAPSTKSVCLDECGKRKVTYSPNCGEVRTRKILIKHEETKEVPTQKCVVQKLCPRCAGCYDDVAQVSPEKFPAAQIADAKTTEPVDQTSEVTAPKNNEPRVITATKSEISRLLTTWRK